MLGFVITGLPALLIIAVILAVFIAGLVTVIRASAREMKRLGHADERRRPGGGAS